MVTKTPPVPQGHAGDPPEDLNPFHIAAEQFDRAAALLPKLERGWVWLVVEKGRDGGRGRLWRIVRLPRSLGHQAQAVVQPQEGGPADAQHMVCAGATRGRIYVDLLTQYSDCKRTSMSRRPFRAMAITAREPRDR